MSRSPAGEVLSLLFERQDSLVVRLDSNRLRGFGSGLAFLCGNLTSAPHVVVPHRRGDGPAVHDVHRCGLHGGIAGTDCMPAQVADFEGQSRLNYPSSFSYIGVCRLDEDDIEITVQ